MKKLLYILLGIILGTTGVVYAATPGGVTIPMGGTGNTAYTAGDIIYSATTGALRFSALPIGAEGTCLGVSASLPAYITCGSGGGSGGVGTSTNPFMATYFVATSTTATSTFGGSLIAPLFDKGGQVYNVKAYGATGNGVTDDYTVVNNVLRLAQTTGGTIYFPKGTYKIGSSLKFPSADNWVTSTAYAVGDYVYESGRAYEAVTAHTSGTFATDLAAGRWNKVVRIKPIRLTGDGADVAGVATDVVPYALTPKGGSILDLTAVDQYGKLDARGHGRLEIDKLTIMDTTEGSSTMLYVLNTTVYVHDNLFWGKNPTYFSGLPSLATVVSTSTQDAIQLGGATTTSLVMLGQNDPNAGFAGWESQIYNNFFDRFRTPIKLRTTANNVTISGNSFWARNGSVANTAASTSPIIDILGASCCSSSGYTNHGSIVNNLLEGHSYPGGDVIRLQYAFAWNISGNGFEDLDTASTTAVRFMSNARRNTMSGNSFTVVNINEQAYVDETNSTGEPYSNMILVSSTATSTMGTISPRTIWMPDNNGTIVGNPLIMKSNTSYMQLQTNTGDFVVTQNAVNPIYSYGSGAVTNSLVVKAGNIGLGTTTPGTNLSIGDTGANTINLSPTSISTFGNGINIRSGCFSVNGTCLSSGGGSAGGTWSTTTSSVLGQFINYPNNSTDIVTIGGTSTTTAKYWFDPNSSKAYIGGNLGLGTTSPYAKLSVEGSSVLGNSALAGYFIATSTTATSTFAGAVGVGIANPADLLHVSGGDIRITRSNSVLNSVTNRVNFVNSNITSTPIAAIEVMTGSASASNSNLIFKTANSGTPAEVLRITGAGNVGIGSTTPPSKLSVYGAGSAGGLNAFGQGTSVNVGIYSTSAETLGRGSTLGFGSDNKFSGATSPYLYGVIMGAKESATVTNDYAGFLSFYTVAAGSGSNERMRISSTGSVGIGTTSPGTLLSIGDTGSNTVNISDTATSTFGSGINLRTGCFAVGGVCISGGGGGSSGPVTTTFEFDDCEPQTDSMGFAPGGAYIQPIYGMTFTNATSSRFICSIVIPQNVSATPNALIIPWLTATGTPSTGIASVDFSATTTGSRQNWYTANYTDIHAASTTAAKRFVLTTGTSLPITSTTTISLSGITLTAGNVLKVEATRYGADAVDTVDNDVFMPKLLLQIDTN